MRDEIAERPNPKCQVNIYVLGLGFCRARNDVELIMRANPKPDVSPISERFGYPLQPQHLFIEVGALLQITDVYGGMIKFSSLVYRTRLGNTQQSGRETGKKAQRECSLLHTGMLQHASHHYLCAQ